MGEFKYLGTTITRDGRMREEIKRRISIAATTCAQMNKIWRTKNLPLGLKIKLFKTLILTILLYNGECWNLEAQDIRMLEGFQFRCLKKITSKIRRKKNPTTFTRIERAVTINNNNNKKSTSTKELPKKSTFNKGITQKK